MPPRKSTSSVTPAEGDEQPPPTQNVTATEQQLKARAEGVSVEDYLLPRSLTLRLAKSVLPPNTSIQKDALLAIQKAATVFVSYLSSHANEATLKRTVAPSDVLAALSELEFDAFRPRLEKELELHMEMMAGKKKAKKPQGDTPVKADDNEEETTVRGAKRVKRDGDGSSPTRDEGVDSDETQDEEEEEEEEDDDQDEDEEDGDEEADEDEAEDEDDIDRVEDLDRDTRPRRTMDPDADNSDTEDDDGPGAQLRDDLGLG